MPKLALMTVLAVMHTAGELAPASSQRALPQSIVATAPFPLAIAMTGSQSTAAARAPLTADTPMRVASNTKTLVAATVLRLWEQHRIDLDSPIRRLLSPVTDATLTADGYDTDRITVRQLLSHSAGLYDHGSDPRYVEMLKSNKTRRFSRSELVRLMTEYADPQSAPGVRFQYSDTGYILLGEIIERRTGLNLASAVRKQLRLDRLPLRATYWERLERAPKRAPRRARQFLGELDVTDVDPSMDLYGGGGLVMSPNDLAIVFKALFDGALFDSPRTLSEMFWKGPHEGADGYRLGIFVKHLPTGDIWWHSGFWGTYAAYAPSTRQAIAAFSDHQAGVKPVLGLLEQLVLEPLRNDRADGRP